MKKKYFWLLRLIISLGLVSYFLVSLSVEHGSLQGALEKFLDAFKKASYELILPAFFLHLIGFSLTSLRWKILIRAQGINVNFSKLFHYYFMAAFFNTFLPSTIGGDTVRALESRKLIGNTTKSFMVVIIERLTGVMALFLIAATAVALKLSESINLEKIIWGFLLAVLLGSGILIATTNPKTAPHLLKLLKKILPRKISLLIEQALQSISIYYKNPKALILALFISIIFQLNMVIYYFLISKSLQQNPDPIDFFMKAPLMIFLLMTVPAVNGIGVRTYVFNKIMYFPKAIALSAEVIDLGMKYFYGLLGGIVYLFSRHSGKKENNQDR